MYLLLQEASKFLFAANISGTHAEVVARMVGVGVGVWGMVWVAPTVVGVVPSVAGVAATVVGVVPCRVGVVPRTVAVALGLAGVAPRVAGRIGVAGMLGAQCVGRNTLLGT